MGVVDFIEYSPNDGRDNGIITINAETNQGAFRSTMVSVSGGG